MSEENTSEEIERELSMDELIEILGGGVSVIEQACSQLEERANAMVAVAREVGKLHDVKTLRRLVAALGALRAELPDVNEGREIE